MTAIPEVSEAEAQGKVKNVFDDINWTLDVPSVGLVFRQLAVYPWFLQLAWRNLKPNVSIVYFHRMSGEIRDMAIHLAGNTRSRLASADSDGSLTAVIDAYAKLLLATGALRAGAHGQIPKLSWISADDKRTMPPQRLQSAGEAIGQQLRSPLPPGAQHGSYQGSTGREASELRESAALVAESLPYRMEISASACRQAGLREEQIDAVQRILDATWNALPPALLTLVGRGVVSKGVNGAPQHDATTSTTGAMATA